MLSKSNPPKFAFFGSDEFAIAVLETLQQEKLPPQLIITTPDRRRGRGLKLLPSPVAAWAAARKITCRQPEHLKNISQDLISGCFLFFLVASYGKIIPQEIFSLPPHGTVNIHPSLLPRYRGPTPIQSALLSNDKKTGVSLMCIDNQLDHGPVLATRTLERLLTDLCYSELRDALARLGAKLFIEILPDWLAGKIAPQPQDENQATYTKKLTKENGLVRLDERAEILDRKFRAFTPWPGLYFFTPDNGRAGPRDPDTSPRRAGRRIKITAAHLESDRFVIDRIIPEGGKEIPYFVFTAR